MKQREHFPEETENKRKKTQTYMRFYTNAGNVRKQMPKVEHLLLRDCVLKHVKHLEERDQLLLL